MTVVMASLAMAGAADVDVELAHLGVQAFQRVMARFEGAAKVLVDNKGVTLSGVFGLPPRAHADDARRAITAAETLRRELEDIGLSCTVGVATGRAFCGDLRQRPAPRVHAARRGGQPRLAPDGGQRRRDPLLRRDRAGGARERRLRGARAGLAEGARRAGGGAPRVVDAQPPRAPRESRMVGREAEQAAIRARIDDLVTERPVGHRRHRGRGRAGQVAARRRGDPPGARARRARAGRGRRRRRERDELLRLALDVHRPARASPRRRWSIRTPSRCRAIRSCGGCARCSAASSRSASPTTS